MKIQKNTNKTIFIIGIIIISLFLIYTLIQEVSYGHLFWEYDAIAALVLTWFLYLIRNKINLNPFHYFLFELFLLMHLLGIFGAYTIKVNWLEYDMIMHGFFGFVAVLIFLNKYDLKISKKEWLEYLIIISAILGLSVLHEIIEYIGAIVIGSGGGFLGFGPGDFGEFDTQIDLIMNLIGILIGISLHITNKLKFKK